MTARVLGIDSGATAAWGLVEGYRVLGFGVLDASDRAADLVRLLREHEPSTVALEIIERVHPVMRGGSAGISTTQALCLYQTGLVTGDLRRVALVHGARAQTATAEEWRKAVVGNAKADNATIDRVLRLRLQGFPAERKSNNHERDALGVAHYVALRLNRG